MRRTKIVCTIGPATASEEAIQHLAEAGMDVARLNFSYGDHAQYAQVIGWVRGVSKQIGRPIAILQDLAGPKLRVGELPNGQAALLPGEQVVISTAATPPPHALPLPVPEVMRVCEPGQRLLLNDGRLELRVTRCGVDDLQCEVVVGGMLRSHQGVNLPDVRIPIRAVTEKDLADLDFGLRQHVDWIAMSFVREDEDLDPIRERISRSGAIVGLMAKIEKHEAIDHLDGIIGAADAVMVARGDLGIEVPLDQVPLLQKAIISRCNAAGKPVVTATQMLESMIQNARPTRAEVSDVANAVLDGTDGVMLSGETAAGEHAFAAVSVMDRVARAAEEAFDYRGRLERLNLLRGDTITDAIAQATCTLAFDLGAKAILTPTSTGHTAEMVARYRPETPILAITENEATQRRLALVWGVYPLVAPRGTNTDEMMRIALRAAQEAGFAQSGDRVIVTAGVPSGIPGRTNLIKVEVVGYHEGVA